MTGLLGAFYRRTLNHASEEANIVDDWNCPQSDEFGPAMNGDHANSLLHAAGVVVRSARRSILRIAATWPWADELVRAFSRLPSWHLVT